MTTFAKSKIGLLILLSTLLVTVPFGEALALISGGIGNAPIRDPGWPQGAAAIFNVTARIAWWEGPPLGGGQWHAECRGDAKELSDVLADFAKLDVKSKQIVLHDGVGHSVWLHRSGDGKRDEAKMDWQFMVWNPASWQQLRKLPADLNPTDPKSKDDDGPPSQIDIYTGGNIKWADVTVPKGLKIIDNRLEAHGFTAADGGVLEGKVTDLATAKPIAAKVRLQSIEQKKKGGYDYKVAAETTADANGRWVLKKAPAGWFRVVIEAEGYIPRIVGHTKIDDQPKWQSFEGGLARPATIAGRVVDDAGKPLADVEVQLADVVANPGGRYQSTLENSIKTDADGRFRAETVAGQGTIWLRKTGYVRPGLGLPFTTPKNDFALTMTKTASVVVTVDFTGKERPGGYIVRIEPEGGDKIGSYGGSGNIDAKRQMVFDNIPPGRYVLHGRPNPGSDNQVTEPFTVDLKGGLRIDVTLLAK